MAALPINKPKKAATTTISKLDLSGGPHTFEFIDFNQFLVIENNESTSITVNVLGDGVTTANCEGLDPIDVSSGYDIAVAAGDSMALYTSERKGYFGGNKSVVNVTITGATGSSFGWIEEY